MYTAAFAYGNSECAGQQADGASQNMENQEREPHARPFSINRFNKESSLHLRRCAINRYICF
jgi:hypothetical protein